MAGATVAVAQNELCSSRAYPPETSCLQTYHLMAVYKFCALWRCKHKVPHPYSHPNTRKTARVGGPGSRSLPIHAKNGREWEPGSRARCRGSG
jgi:hypothetical protein